MEVVEGWKERIEVIEKMGGRYALRRWMDEEGDVLVGVERQFDGCRTVD